MFKAGIVSAVALFGLAWLTDTFIVEWETEIIDTVGGWVTDYQSVFFFGVFLVAALTTSHSTATRTIVPIGLALGLSPAAVSAMWAGGFAGVFTSPQRVPDRGLELRHNGHRQARHQARGPLVHPAGGP